MNKVYRLVWNKATQTWNAVSEYAKSQGKSTNAVIMPSLKGAYGVMRTLVRFAYTALVSALLLLSGRAAIAATGTTTGSGQAVPSTADYNTCYYDVTSQSVVCGTADTKTANTSDTKTAKAVVIGQGTTNTGESNIAIGTSSATGSTTFTETVTAVTKNGTTTTNTEVTFNPTGTPGTTTNTTTTTDSSGANITTVVTATTKEAQPVAAIAIGNEAKAYDNHSIAIGQKATANADWDISIGRNAGSGITFIAPEGRNIAIGDGALKEAVLPNNNIAMGTDASSKQKGNFNVVIGTYANSPTALGSTRLDNGNAITAAFVEANDTVAIGERALAIQSNAVSIGNRSKSTGTAAVAIGTGSEASGNYAIAQGYSAVASGVSSVAIGAAQNLGVNQTRATGNFSVALGSIATKASGDSSVAIGKTATAPTDNSIAIGKDAKVEAEGLISNGQKKSIGAIAIGNASTSQGKASVAIGNEVSSQTHGVAIGVKSTASEVGAIAIGQNNTATTANSAALGSNTHATGSNSFAAGNASNAAGQSSIAIGDGAKANTDTTVGGNGWGTAVGNGATAEWAASAYGYQAKATGGASVAVGNAAAKAQNSIAVGNEAKANDTGSIAIGYDAIASKNNAIALGNNAKSKAEATIAIGQNAGLTSDATTSNTNTRAIMMGVNAAKGAQNVNDSILMGQSAGENLGVKTATGSHNIGLGARALQNASGSTNVALATEAGTGAEGNNNFFGQVGAGSYVKGDNNIAIGKNAQKGTDADIITANDTIVLGTESKANKDNAIAIGKGAQASAENAISIGTGNVVSGENSGALGYPSYISGAGTYTIGNDNGTAVKPISANNAGVFGNNNALSGHGSRIVGNSNTVSGENTFVMGNDVTATAQNNVILGHKSSESSATTTNGQSNQVDDATVGAVTYNGFAGTASGVVSVGASGAERQIINVAPGKISADSTDAINGSQLYAVASQVKSSIQTIPLTVNAGKVDTPATANTGKLATAGDIANAINNTGFTLTTAATANGEVAGTSNELIKAGDTVTLEADKNIKVTQANGKVTIATKDDVNFNSVIANGTKIDNTGFSFVDAAGTKVVNTPSITRNGIDLGGQKITNVQAGSATTDAVNVGQLNTVKNTVEGKLGGFTVGADKNATAAGIDVNKDNARFDVVGADNGKVTTAIDGNKISVDLTADAKASLGKADTAVQGIKVKANGNDVTTLDKDNNTLEITQGDNITVANDNGKVKVSLKSDVAGLDSLTSKVVTAGAGDSQVILNDNGVNVGGNTYISKDGLNANNKKVANVADGDISATSKDAVNGSQLYATNQNVATNATNITNLQNQTFKLQANGDTATAVKASDTVQFLNGENIAITRNGNDITVATKKDLVVDSVKAGDTLVNKAGVVIKAPVGGTTSDVKLTAAGLDNGKNKITNVAAGTDDTDAVNVSQLKAVETKAAVKTKVTAGDGVDVTNTGTADAPNYTVAINQATKDDIAKGVAAKDVVDNKGLTFAGDSGTTGVKKLGDSISVKGDNNITTKADANGVLVTLNKDLNVNSVIANGTKIDDNGLSFVDASGSTVANSPAISKTGINAGNQKITNVAAGTDDTDAVNLAQLKAAKSSTTAGKNITVKTVQNNDGSTSYEVATKDEVTFNKTTVGNVITDAATDKITGLTAGDVSATSTDAVNGSQLHAHGAGVKNIIGGNTTYNPATGNYTNVDIGGTGKDNIDAAIKAVKTEVKAGDNIAVTSNVDADGKTTYTVATKKDLVVDSVKAGDKVTLNNAGLTAGNVSVTTGGINAGNAIITNVQSGLNGKTLEQIKADPNATERNNAATIGDLATVQNNVTNINNNYNTVVNKVIGGTTPDGKVTDANGDIVRDNKGKEVNVSDALKTYNVSGNHAKTDNTLITAIKNINEGGIKFFHVNDGTGNQNVTGSDTHAEDSAASGNFAAAVGYQAKASGANAIAFGNGAEATAENAISIGTGNKVSGKNSGAIGDPSIITGNNSYSVGNNNTVSTNNTFVLGNNVTQTVDNSVFLGNNTASTGVHTTANGGNYTYAGMNDAGVSGVSDVVGVVSVGKEGETRQIQNVAAGVVSATSTDAINGSQLYATAEGLAGTTINMGNQLNNRINEVKDDANAGVSSAMAMAALPQAYIPGKSMLTGGMATYNGQGAVAVGLSKLSDNGRWVLKVSGSADTKGNAGGAVGAGFHF